jgi:hypothetical protein
MSFDGKGLQLPEKVGQLVGTEVVRIYNCSAALVWGIGHVEKTAAGTGG